MTLPMLEQGQNWYAAFTHTNAEVRAIMHLQNQGFAAYLPRYLKRRRSGRRVDLVARPLFPRYVFVGLDIARERWRSVNGTIGITYLVSQGERPAPLDVRVLQAIAAREDEDGLVRLASAPMFKPGQTVRVMEGAFADQIGLYEGCADQERVRILLNLLGRKVRVMIDTVAIAAA